MAELSPEAIKIVHDGLTDEQCDAFRRLPCSFRDMVRTIYAAGATARQRQDAEIAREWDQDESGCDSPREAIAAKIEETPHRG